MIETIIKLKVTCHDDSLTDVSSKELGEFIVETLDNEFRKDDMDFEVIEWLKRKRFWVKILKSM